MFRKSNKDEMKAKLEHKLYLARETPEPIFDLSECGIKQVPPGIYSLCKVFLKDVLILSHNNLTTLRDGGNLRDLTLLKILDLQNNCFTQLPEEIGLLNNLIELHINNNQLKRLPSNICNLSALQILDISSNNLQCLPPDFGNLNNLKELNLLNNKKLTHLPISIGHLQKLNEIKVDHEVLQYPPRDVAERGTRSILIFMCEDLGIEYDPKSNNFATAKGNVKTPTTNDDCDNKIQAKLWELDKIKAQKMQEFIEIEKQNEMMQQQEFELANTSRANREKARRLLKFIGQQQDQMNQDLLKIQREKDSERFKLIEQLHEVERRADLAIKHLLTIKDEPLLKLLEQEMDQEARLLEIANKYNEQLRKDDILDAMRRLIEEETKQFEKIDLNRTQTANSILEEELQRNSRMVGMLKGHAHMKNELITRLQSDDELQKVAVAALLERSDARTWGLAQQVRLVESKLAELTSIELDKRKLELEDQVMDIAEKRLHLSLLLMELLDKQERRRAELINTLKSLEDSYLTAEDFWLRQYQNLLDRMPANVMNTQRNMDTNLAEGLLSAGVVHCIPFLAKWSTKEVQFVTENDLIEAGITKEDDRERVLNAIALHAKSQVRMTTSQPLPSAPADDDDVKNASAPAVASVCLENSECVICMDQNCQIIFVPCGHYCCCSNCSTTIEDCPLCRGAIDKKIRVIQA